MSLSKAYASSGKIFEQVSKRYNPALYEQLTSVKKGDIVVVEGQHDHIEKLLDVIKVPYELIGRDAMGTHNGGRVMLVNCARYGASVPKSSIDHFVEAGGRLVTTDWALDVVTHTFPKKLQKVKSTGDDVVEIQCHTDLARKLVGLNYAQCHPKWWLEGSSDIYDVGQGVTPIITSEEMKEKYGKPYVAVGFRHGKGEVFHFISHLELQRTHLKTKEDTGSLDEFVKKMKIEKTPDMEDAKVAELESAFSTLNTLAHLCSPIPLLYDGGMKSIMTAGSAADAAKSKKLV